MPAWISPNLVLLLVFITLVSATGALGGQRRAGPWYAALSKPDWTPLLNAARSYIFFGRHEIALGLIDILALWATIAAFAVAAWPVNQWASLLFIPYLLWVTYAAALNGSIWLRNPAAASS